MRRHLFLVLVWSLICASSSTANPDFNFLDLNSFYNPIRFEHPILVENPVPFDNPEHWKAFNEGLCTGFDLGWSNGQSRGQIEGQQNGRSAGYQAGWDANYQPAFDRAYAPAFDEGFQNSLSLSFLSAFRDGFKQADEELNRFGTSGAGFVLSGVLTAVDPYWLEASNGTLNFSPWGVNGFLSTYDLFYRQGYHYGYSVGDLNGYNEAYPAAYDLAYQGAFPVGSAEGASQGAANGFASGLRDGESAGGRQGSQVGFDEGYAFRMAGGTYDQIVSFAGNRLVELFGVQFRHPQMAYSTVAVDSTADFSTDGYSALSAVPEPSITLIWGWSMIFLILRGRGRGHRSLG